MSYSSSGGSHGSSSLNLSFSDHRHLAQHCACKNSQRLTSADHDPSRSSFTHQQSQSPDDTTITCTSSDSDCNTTTDASYWLNDSVECDSTPAISTSVRCLLDTQRRPGVTDLGCSPVCKHKPLYQTQSPRPLRCHLDKENFNPCESVLSSNESSQSPQSRVLKKHGVRTLGLDRTVTSLKRSFPRAALRCATNQQSPYRKPAIFSSHFSPSLPHRTFRDLGLNQSHVSENLKSSFLRESANISFVNSSCNPKRKTTCCTINGSHLENSHNHSKYESEIGEFSQHSHISNRSLFREDTFFDKNYSAGVHTENPESFPSTSTSQLTSVLSSPTSQNSLSTVASTVPSSVLSDSSSIPLSLVLGTPPRNEGVLHGPPSPYPPSLAQTRHASSLYETMEESPAPHHMLPFRAILTIDARGTVSALCVEPTNNCNV